MQIWPQIIIIKLIAHATAIEADVVPLRCVVSWGSIHLADLPQPSMTVDFVHRNTVVDRDLLTCETVPFVQQILSLFIAHVFCVGLVRQSFVVGLPLVVGIFLRAPFLLAFQI